LRDFIEKIVYGGGILFDLAKWFIATVVLLSVITTFFVAIFTVDGASMEPNLHDRELVLWNKNAYSGSKKPAKNDVVVVNYKGDPAHRKYVKRIVGLPNDAVKIENGAVYVNGVLEEQGYLSFDVETMPDGQWQVAADQYFVMGDNRPNSNDSRNFGPVEKRFVLGKALAIVFPRFRLIKDI